MSMVFRFRMLSDENDRFLRDYEVLYDMTLLEFHEFLLEALEYEPCMASFFTADDRWEKLREFTLMDMGEGMGFDEEDMPIPMSKVTLAEIVIAEYTRLIYLFDMFANRAYYIELVSSAQPNPQLDYPRVAFENAPVPDQYDPDAVDSTSGSIFDEMMDDFSEFGGDDSYDDEY